MFTTGRLRMAFPYSLGHTFIELLGPDIDAFSVFARCMYGVAARPLCILFQGADGALGVAGASATYTFHIETCKVEFQPPIGRTHS